MNDERPRLRRVKVLVAGMNTGNDNRFARILRMYPNVEVLHESGDPTGTCNTNGDAALIALSQISHGKTYTVRDTYKALGKKVFFVRNGFTEIKQQFEDWLDEKSSEIENLATQEMPKPRETAMSHAFKQAMQKPEPPPVPTAPANEPPAALTQFQRRVRWTNNFIMSETKKRTSADTIAKKLNSFGLTTRNGNEWVPLQVKHLARKLADENFVIDPEVLKEDPPIYNKGDFKRPPQTAAAPPPPAPAPVVVAPPPAPEPPPPPAPPAPPPPPAPEPKRDAKKDHRALMEMILHDDSLSKEKKMKIFDTLLDD